MEWNATFLPEGRIVVIETSGIGDKESSMEMTKSIVKTMMVHQVGALPGGPSRDPVSDRKFV